jgi:hypothetical protein
MMICFNDCYILSMLILPKCPILKGIRHGVKFLLTLDVMKVIYICFLHYSVRCPKPGPFILSLFSHPS